LKNQGEGVGLGGQG